MEYEEVENLERQAGVGLVGRWMDRHYRQSRLNTEIRFNLADVYVYRSVTMLLLLLCVLLILQKNIAVGQWWGSVARASDGLQGRGGLEAPSLQKLNTFAYTSQ